MVKAVLLHAPCLVLTILRIVNRLMHSYQAGQSSTLDSSAATQSAHKSSVSQTDLYASYIARFGVEGADDAARTQSFGYQSDAPSVVRDSSPTGFAPRGDLSLATTSTGDERPDICRDDSGPKVDEKERELGSLSGACYPWT